MGEIVTSCILLLYRDLGTSLNNLQTLWMAKCGLADLDGISSLCSLKVRLSLYVKRTVSYKYTVSNIQYILILKTRAVSVVLYVIKIMFIYIDF